MCETDASGELGCSTGSSAWHSVMTQMGGIGWGGREESESRNQHNIVKQLYSKKKKKKKEKKKTTLSWKKKRERRVNPFAFDRCLWSPGESMELWFNSGLAGLPRLSQRSTVSAAPWCPCRLRLQHGQRQLLWPASLNVGQKHASMGSSL